MVKVLLQRSMKDILYGLETPFFRRTHVANNRSNRLLGDIRGRDASHTPMGMQAHSSPPKYTETPTQAFTRLCRGFFYIGGADPLSVSTHTRGR